LISEIILNIIPFRNPKETEGGGSNPLIRIFPSPGGRGQGRGVFFNGFDPLPN
jgi:hypothetical protein